MIETQNIVCHGCGVSVAKADNICEYCGNPVVITTFSSAKSMSPPLLNKYIVAYKKDLSSNQDGGDSSTALAFCYLRLKLYDKAQEAFGKALENNLDNAEIFYYAAICMLKGKKAFLAPRADIDKAMEYLQAAIMIEARSIYYYLLAYIKYDFFSRKSYKINPDYEEEFAIASSNGLSIEDVEFMYELLYVDRPSCL